MPSSSNASLMTAINDIKQLSALLIQVGNISLFIFGVIGHSLNIYIFTRPKFCRNPCVRYFLATTLSGCGVVCFTTPLRLLQISYNLDVFIYSFTTCKILSYILPCFRVLSSWFLVLAFIDRVFRSSSSATVRAWSNVRTATFIIVITSLVVCLAYTQLFFYQTILLLPQPTCTLASTTYQTFYSLWNLFFWSLIPMISMLIFGLLIIRNIRQGKMRIVPQNQLQRYQKKTDQQLIRMLLFQSFLFGLTTMAFSIGSLYVSITNTLKVKNSLEKIQDTLLTNTVNCISNISACLNFYIYTLSSQLFRRELINLFHRILMKRVGIDPNNRN